MPNAPHIDQFFDALEARRLMALFTVTNLNDAGAGSLRSAVLGANASVGVADVIEFDANLTGTVALTSRLTVSDDLTITGPGQDRLTLSGENATMVLDIAPGAHVGVSGLTIANGADASAGGIENGGLLTLTNVTITSNSTPGGNAGGIFNSATLTLDSCTFTNNTTNNGSAAAVTSTGTLSIDNCTFSGNTVSSGDGGAVVFSGVATIGDSIFSNNSAGTGPGGALAVYGIAVVTDSTFNGNSAQDGGALANFGTLTLTGSTLASNLSTNRGGGVYNSNLATSSIANSTISGNSAANFGGGIYLQGGTVNLDNSTLTGNSAGAGGGIHNIAGTVTLRSTILAANAATDFTGAALNAGSVNNLIGDGASAGGLVDGVNGNIVGHAALLGPLAQNGGRTGTHALLAGSPAIGAGLNPGSLPFDQRGVGFPRVRGSAIDIGAVEFTSTPTIDSLTPSAASVVRGQTVTLTANGVASSDGQISRVDFYLDSNDDGVADAGELIGADSSAGDGFSLAYNTIAGLALGATRFMAIAVDADGGTSQPAQANVTITNAAPTLGALTPGAAQFEQGRAFTLSAANAADPDGAVASVRFFADLNHNGVADEAELLGVDTNGADGYSYTLTSTQTLGLPLGAITFLAVATDADGGTSGVVTGTSTMLFSIHARDGLLVTGTADRADASRVSAVNAAGHVIVFEQGWNAFDLNVLTGAPNVIGDPVIWLDNDNGLIYAAAPSASGLLMFTRLGSGQWTVRNLSTETNADESPARGLTQFSSIDGHTTVIAGITNTNRIVAFQESTVSGAPQFTVLDLSSDLESQGMTTPHLASLISYVPTWDAWHLAGIDSDGRIQSVWINHHVDGFTKWRVDDLSASTGAPALLGQLAVMLTSWGGINLTGLNTEGNLLTTWWVPEFGGEWRVNNLTSQFSGTPLVDGNVSGYTTPWGGLNYVGLDEGGHVVVYWWAPGVTDWSVTPLLPESVPVENRPAGELTSSSSPAGTLNVYGSSASGDVIRMWWKPSGAPEWTAENLTAVAVRQ